MALATPADSPSIEKLMHPMESWYFHIKLDGPDMALITQPDITIAGERLQIMKLLWGLMTQVVVSEWMDIQLRD